MTLPDGASIGTPVLTYHSPHPRTQDWRNFNATFVANVATGSLVLFADSTDPAYQSAVGADAIRVTRVRCVHPPVTTNDSQNGVAPGSQVTIDVLNNDNDNENDIDPSTVSIVTAGATDSDGDGDMDTLVVPGEGTWSVNNTTGAITFTPVSGFAGSPTPIQYTVEDTTGLLSNVSTVTITVVVVHQVTPVPTLSSLGLFLLMLLMLGVIALVFRLRHRY
jgi:CshA-type fibril repeat protein